MSALKRYWVERVKGVVSVLPTVDGSPCAPSLENQTKLLGWNWNKTLLWTRSAKKCLICVNCKEKQSQLILVCGQNVYITLLNNTVLALLLLTTVTTVQ